MTSAELREKYKRLDREVEQQEAAIKAARKAVKDAEALVERLESTLFRIEMDRRFTEDEFFLAVQAEEAHEAAQESAK